MKRYSGIAVRGLVLAFLLGVVALVEKPQITRAMHPCPDIDVRACWIDGGIYDFELCKCEF